MKFSIRRVWGVIIRHLYNFVHTWERITDAFYWPVFDIIVWSLTLYAMQKQGQASAGYTTMIISAVVLWFVVWRGQYEITVNLLEELWGENLGNLFTTPLTVAEWTVALLVLGILKLFITVVFTSIVAYFLFGVNILNLGSALLPFIGSLLVTGWWVGLFIASLFLRYGTKIQTLAWVGGFVLMPFSATYFPLSTLPGWLQSAAQFVPSMYIFEGMRVVLATGRIPWGMITLSMFLNIVYFSLCFSFFIRSFRSAKVNGLSHIR